MVKESTDLDKWAGEKERERRGRVGQEERGEEEEEEQKCTEEEENEGRRRRF